MRTRIASVPLSRIVPAACLVVAITTCKENTGPGGAPAAPSNLLAFASLNGTYWTTLNWTDNSTNEDGFRIERTPGGIESYAEIATIRRNGIHHADLGLAAGTCYSYRVQAYNGAGPSPYSNAATAMTPGAPPAPANLLAIIVSDSQIDVTWTDESCSEDGFRIERAVGETGAFVEIVTIEPNMTAYQNTGLTSGTRYSYRVRAYNAFGPSAHSNTAAATTLGVARVLVIPDSATAEPGSAVQLAATLLDAQGKALTDRAATWSSSDENVARVDQSGLVTAGMSGSARIVAASQGHRDSAVIVVMLPHELLYGLGPLCSVVGCSTEIVLASRDRKNHTNLTNHPYLDKEPTWSPDAAKIAFYSDRGPNGIYVMNADGTDQHYVTDGEYPAWSPMSSLIAFDACRRLIIDGVIDNYCGIFVADSDGSNERLLARYGSRADWSPDGLQVAFDNSGGLGLIYVINADGTGLRAVTQSGGRDWVGDGSPTWSPDGSRIAFTRAKMNQNYAFPYQLYVINVDGSGMRQITEGLDVSHPDWAPDGSLIVFTGYPDLYVIRPDGTGPARITDIVASPPIAGWPAWKPVGP